MKRLKGGISMMSIVLMFFAAGCNSSNSEKAKTFDPVGTWEYKVTTDVSYGKITISGNPEAYKASMTTEVFGNLDVMNLVIQDIKLSGDLDVGGTPAKLIITFDGDKMTGAVTAGEDRFPMEGQRAAE